MLADYETTVGITVLENKAERNGQKHSHNKVSYNYLSSVSPTLVDHNSRRSRN